jgi:hypothetical protein
MADLILTIEVWQEVVGKKELKRHQNYFVQIYSLS